jgi:hypothetical protein
MSHEIALRAKQLLASQGGAPQQLPRAGRLAATLTVAVEVLEEIRHDVLHCAVDGVAGCGRRQRGLAAVAPLRQGPALGLGPARVETVGGLEEAPVTLIGFRRLEPLRPGVECVSTVAGRLGLLVGHAGVHRKILGSSGSGRVGLERQDRCHDGNDNERAAPLHTTGPPLAFRIL